MTTPPRPSPADIEQAISRIAERHPDDAHLFIGDPLATLVYLRRCGAAGLLGDDDTHDITDGLTVRLGQWWDGEATELYLLNAAEHLGLWRRRVGRVLGIASAQGLLVRHLRKRAMFDPSIGKPNVEAVRATRRAGQHKATWLAEHSGQLRAFARLLLQHRDHLGDDVAEDLDDLAGDMPAGGAVTAGFASQLRLILGEIAASGATVPVDLRAAVRQVSALLGSDPHRL